MSEIGYLIKEIAGKGKSFSTFPAIVSDNQIVEIDRNKEYVVSVRLLADIESYSLLKEAALEAKTANDSVVEIHNVRLKAAINGIDEGIICIPRIGSWVLVSTIENMDARTYVSQYSEIDRVILRMNKPKSKEDENQAPEYIDIDINATTLSLTYGDLFKTTIGKEALQIAFLAPKENEQEDSAQKVQSSLKYTKDQLDITFNDEDEQAVTTAIIEKGKATITITDGCGASVEKTKAKLHTKDEKEVIQIDEKEGLLLKSSSAIKIEGDSVSITGKTDITMTGGDINLN